MLTTAGRDAALGGIGATHIGLLSAITNWRAGTVTETDYTGYARIAVTWNAAAVGTYSRKLTNNGTLTFPQNTGSNKNVIAYGIYTALSGGSLRGIGLLGSDQAIAGVVDAATDTVTAYAHGLEADQRVFVLQAPIGGAPDVFTENVAYYVLASGLTADAFKLSTTSAGAAVNPTSSGIALFLPYTVQTVANAAFITIPDGTIELKL